jgi:hypothetical protein
MSNPFPHPVMDDFHRRYREITHPGRRDLIVRGLRAVAARNLMPSRKTKLRQLLEVVAFSMKYRVDPNSYYRHGLNLRWSERNSYIFHDEIVAVLHHLNRLVCANDAADLSDKRRFSIRCREAGLPSVESLLEFEDGVINEIASDARQYERDLFSKFASRFCGEGATVWQYQNGHYESNDGRFTRPELMQHLANLSKLFPIMLQRRVANHPALMPISNKALSTVRVVTARRPGGPIHVALAALRMARGDAAADNFAAGGIASPIALDSGVLGKAAAKDGCETDESFPKHPDTGAEIEGRVVPNWEAVKDLAISAHVVFGTMPSVGWDIAVADDGLVLLEGNAVWCVELAQISHKRPLADTIVPEILCEYLRNAAAAPTP